MKQEPPLDFSTLPTVVAVVGSRSWKKEAWIEKLVAQLKPQTIVVSGGAIGVDSFAEKFTLARKDKFDDIHFKGFDVEDFEWNLLDRGVALFRNEIIVRYVKRFKGVVLIFAVLNDKGEVEGGSKDVIKHCTALGVPYYLYTVTGAQNV